VLLSSLPALVLIELCSRSRFRPQAERQIQALSALLQSLKMPECPDLELTSGADEAEQMSLIAISSKIAGGACVVALSFLITLKLLDYQESTTAISTDSAASEHETSRGSAPAR
jgi:hypothetical protein